MKTMIFSKKDQNAADNREEVQKFIDSRAWFRDSEDFSLPINPNGRLADQLVQILTDFNNDDRLRISVIEVSDEDLKYFIDDNGRHLSANFIQSHLLGELRLITSFDETLYDFERDDNEDVLEIIIRNRITHEPEGTISFEVLEPEVHKKRQAVTSVNLPHKELLYNSPLIQFYFDYEATRSTNEVRLSFSVYKNIVVGYDFYTNISGYMDLKIHLLFFSIRFRTNLLRSFSWVKRTARHRKLVSCLKGNVIIYSMDWCNDTQNPYCPDKDLLMSYQNAVGNNDDTTIRRKLLKLF